MRPDFLLIFTYAGYAISFLLPAYTSTNTIYINTNTTVLTGWKCAAATFALIFEHQFTFTGIALSMPNVLMILSVLIYRKTGLAFLIFVLIYNLISCSCWWFLAVLKGQVSDLLPGYWVWFISIVASDIIFIISKQIRK